MAEMSAPSVELQELLDDAAEEMVWAASVDGQRFLRDFMNTGRQAVCRNPDATAPGTTIALDNYIFFWTPPSAFDQWMPCCFSVDGIQYTSAEQFMMAAKARLFGDEQQHAAIMATQDPRKLIRYGKKVRRFTEDVWRRHRFDIVLAGNRAKYGQNATFRDLLLATGDRVLVEASPKDQTWGIGLAPREAADEVEAQPWRFSDKGVYRAEVFEGQNLLGQVLMTVRAELRE